MQAALSSSAKSLFSNVTSIPLKQKKGSQKLLSSNTVDPARAYKVTPSAMNYSSVSFKQRAYFFKNMATNPCLINPSVVVGNP